MASDKKYITITGLQYYCGSAVMEIGTKCKLEKDTKNRYDDEAIKVQIGKATVGYVANSARTVVRGTYSAGRLYDKFDAPLSAKIMFIADDFAIAKLLSLKVAKKKRE